MSQPEAAKETAGGVRAPKERRRAALRGDPRRLFADRAARWVIKAGGLAIIASVLGIFVFILHEVWPLFERSRIFGAREIPLEGAPAQGLVSDEHRTHVAALGGDGRLRVVRTSDGELVLEEALYPPPEEGAAAPEEGPDLPERVLLRVQSVPGRPVLTASTFDGRILAVPISWGIEFEGQTRITSPERPEPVIFEMDASGGPLGAFSARLDEEGSGAAVAQLEDRSVVLVQREVRRNLLTGEARETFTRDAAVLDRRLTQLLLGGEARNLYGGTSGGEILWWRPRGGKLGKPAAVSAGAREISALSFLIGDRSLVVGQADGSLSIWFPVRQPDERMVLTRIRDLPRHGGRLGLLAPSLRVKGFLAQDEDGLLGLYHSTSRRVLWRGPSPLPEATALAFTPKGDGVYLSGPGRIVSMEVRNPHPESSLAALFKKVWYEGYPEPDHVWQSSSATDDFEPKLSLTPLAIGTLKGTFYSLLLAVPLGVLGAMYTSQFMHPKAQRYVKPTVEIMAALPTVVIGFIAGLWLAPRVEQLIPSLTLMIVLLPALVLAGGQVWDRLPPRLKRSLPTGSEIALLMLALLLGIWLCIRLGPGFESLAFGGDFRAWLLETTGLQYDQRNAVVVGLAMGFAVIPIIFAISEDAFSNVPRHLISGSLALGASRWQTVTRVVLPMASPGIFSAIMIGFGRAVGETMIVLMATGNTPVMDWSPFNGFRTLSANIAVEIPEAPQGGTLYRILFLAGLLLFVVTFLANTAAELVRLRLRRKYSGL